MAIPVRTLVRAAATAGSQSLLRGEGKRIGNVGAVALICLALFFDVLQTAQLIPILGVFFAALSPIITLCAYIFILSSLKLFFRDVELLGGSQVMMKCGGFFGSLVIEFVPFLSLIPAVTPGVVALIVATRIEDMRKKPLEEEELPEELQKAERNLRHEIEVQRSMDEIPQRNLSRSYTR